MPSLILTVIGPDRPGLVRALSAAVAEQGGSWLESRMARLAGQFAGIVLVETPGGLTNALAEALRSLEREGLQIVVRPSQAPLAQTGGQRLRLEVVGNDRPGIVRDVTRVVAACGLNIEELTTDVQPGAISGGNLFRATALLRAPAPEAMEAARAGLEELGNELMVDIQALAES